MSSLDVVLFLPLFTGIFVRLFGARLGKTASASIACASVLVAFGFALGNVLGLAALPEAGRQILVHVYDMLDVGLFNAGFNLLLDPLSGMMILIVTGVGFLIHLYAVGYMNDEDAAEYSRFFSYMNFFIFSMLTLVLAANFLVIFVGW
ncbi:MAG: NADH-quinone oxidoreductase subunit L, partial [bacterium]